MPEHDRAVDLAIVEQPDEVVDMLCEVVRRRERIRSRPSAEVRRDDRTPGSRAATTGQVREFAVMPWTARIGVPPAPGAHSA